MAKWKVPEGMAEASIWVVWAFLAIGALGGGLFVLLDFFGAKADAPAWIQAIGSVLAILAAVWISSRQHVELRRERNAQERAICSVVTVIAWRMASLTEALQTNLLTATNVSATLGTWIELIQRERAALQELDLLRMPKAEIIHMILPLSSNVEFLLDTKRGYDGGVMTRATVEDKVGKILDNMRFMHSRLENIEKSYGVSGCEVA